MAMTGTEEGSDRAGLTFSEGARARLARVGELAGSKRGLVTLALLMAMTVSALEQTVVSTAMTSIIASLHGLDIFPWVFSAYLLAATVTTPLYGKLADRLGRKRVLLFGLGLFALGSVLSGLAQSMPQLIAMRVLQGLGAGSIGPVVLTMLGDMFTLKERARVQGLFSAVWGLSSVAGPAVGGVLTDRLSWRWVFFVTAPFSVVAMWILVTQVEDSKGDRGRDLPPVDWWGATLLSASTSALMLAVLRGGEQTLIGGLALVAAGLVLLVLFVRQEHRAADPLLPIDLLMTPNVAASVALSFLIGAVLFGIDTYVPLFVQGVRGGTATAAGRAITPLFLSWAVSVAVAARVVMPLGFRRTGLIGSVFITLGTLGLALGAAYPAWSTPLFAAGMVVIGFGMGPTSLSCILDVQNSVARDRRGTATGTVIFSRTLGGALGVGLLGASLGFALAGRLAAIRGVDVAAALRPETHGKLLPGQLAAVQDALGRSVRDVFLIMAAMAVAGFLCAFGLRGGPAVSHADAGRRPEVDGEELTLAAIEH